MFLSQQEVKNFVLDASIALAWCFADEQTKYTTQLLQRLETETAFVPAIWTLEVGNILINSEKRGRITFADINQYLELLGHLNIKIDNESTERGFHEILSLAYSQRLTTYDAAYLELAMRLGLPLASKDKQLCSIAEKLGTPVLRV